ncbi:MAG: glycosyltransferase, partial [Gammaproteobacteria bacterium]|nr:glycosyltransferase [Gammaproteobacteria bacterium]
ADILHARSRLPAWLCYLAWRGMTQDQRPRFVTSVHGCYSVNRYSRIMLSGERVIAISKFINAYIEDNYQDIDSSKIITIPRGVSGSQ